MSDWIRVALGAAAPRHRERHPKPKTSEHLLTLTTCPAARKTLGIRTMKLKLPTSVQVKGPNGETIEVSAAQVIEHVVRTGRGLGQSPDVEGVRCGARILAAAQGGDLTEGDLAELKKAIAKPSRGWVSIGVDVSFQVAPSSGNPAGITTQRRFFMPSAIEMLPLIEALLAL